VTPLFFVLVVAGISFLAGFLGSLLGLGGGMIVIPALTLMLHPPGDRRFDYLGHRDVERRGSGVCA
jgi:uncharacterized membrane protein YfcA